MRTMVFMAALAVALGPALAAPTPEQYAAGPQWESSLAGSPEARLMGATAITSWNGNVYVLQGNLLRKFGPDLKEIASAQLPDLSLVLTSLEQSRGLISCGMHGEDPSGRMAAAQNQFHSTMSNNWPSTAPAQQAAVASQDLLQGLHEAHTVNGLSGVALTADQYGVYLLRGGRLTVFDYDLRQVRSQEIATSTAGAADCPLCRAAAGDGATMD